MTDPKPAAASTADIAAALDALRDLLARSAEAVRRGDMMDLSGLDAEVKLALDAATALPPAQARALLPALDAVLAALDALEGDLKAVQGVANPAPETASRRIRAAAAYRKPEDF